MTSQRSLVAALDLNRSFQAFLLSGPVSLTSSLTVAMAIYGRFNVSAVAVVSFCCVGTEVGSSGCLPGGVLESQQPRIYRTVVIGHQRMGNHSIDDDARYFCTSKQLPPLPDPENPSAKPFVTSEMPSLTTCQIQHGHCRWDAILQITRWGEKEEKLEEHSRCRGQMLEQMGHVHSEAGAAICTPTADALTNSHFTSQSARVVLEITTPRRRIWKVWRPLIQFPDRSLSSPDSESKKT
ncbi:hypothetical protein N657DRAFT_639883 [Parathielavia appendiculata]|uniref:Uncharacterized protein n=1 Tax=Parathielavia appendiculata TaxID=2587402 RepID=A0AAN6Z849_9PEZI|nr:hypothetical protein N657DRAFT_639883 [Parathielavia appendiculata]